MNVVPITTNMITLACTMITCSLAIVGVIYRLHRDKQSADDKRQAESAACQKAILGAIDDLKTDHGARIKVVEDRSVTYLPRDDIENRIEHQPPTACNPSC